jgi:hypothetical protein
MLAGGLKSQFTRGVGPVGGFYDARRQVDPQLFPLLQRRESDPFQHGAFVSPQVEDGVGGRAVEKVHAAALALSLDEESPNAMAGDSDQVIVPAAQGEADQLNQSLVATGQLTAQSEKALAVLAEAVQTGVYRAPVRPKKLIAFEEDVAAMSVLCRISTKKNSKGTWHPFGTLLSS